LRLAGLGGKMAARRGGNMTYGTIGVTLGLIIAERLHL